MAENRDKSKKKKTLSLKLGTKPLLAPKKNIEGNINKPIRNIINPIF